MEYTIGTVQRGKSCRMILKTKDVAHTDLDGRVSLEMKLGNTLIRDAFTVVKKYQSAEDLDGNCYDWYYICDHYRHEDRTEEVRSECEQEVTDLEIESMEQEQAITENEIAIMELQEAVETITSAT